MARVRIRARHRVLRLLLWVTARGCSALYSDEMNGTAEQASFSLPTAFGQPAQAAMGKGWAQEWLARTLQQPLSDFNTTTNSTLHTETYFPLDQNLYVDATHDTGAYCF